MNIMYSIMLCQVVFVNYSHPPPPILSPPPYCPPPPPKLPTPLILLLILKSRIGFFRLLYVIHNIDIF